MWEFEIMNRETKERMVIFGNWFEDACLRNLLKPADWTMLNRIYID